MQAATPGPQPDIKPHYIPGLDLARGVAILMVLLDHGLAYDQTIYQAYGTRAMLGLSYILRLGHFGVHLFFILSGLLITGILLDTRADPGYFRNFYTRRLLRIAPAYLLMLAVLLATHSITARYLVLCVLCLCNMPSLFGVGNQYSALWSLSVEEQFYLVWPITVRKLSLRSLTILCAAIVALTPVLRFALLYGPHVIQDVRFKTWAVADFFAAGALIAIAARTPNLRQLLPKAVAPLLLFGALSIVLQHFTHPSTVAGHNVMHAIYLEPWLLGLSGFVLFTFLTPKIATSLAARPLIFLAKISYGLYLVHPFAFGIVGRHWPLHSSTTPGLFPQLLIRFLIEAALAIAIATLSRFTFEQFFLRLKPKHQTRATVAQPASKIT